METLLTFLLVFVLIVFFLVFLFELLELVFRVKEAHLHQKITEFLTNFGDEALLSNFFSHPFYEQSVLNAKGLPLHTLKPHHFGLIFWDILSNPSDGNHEALNTNINKLKNTNIQNILSKLVNQPNFTPETLIHQLSDWYSQFTVKILAAYRNKIRAAFFILTLLVVLAFDIDAVDIFYRISTFSTTYSNAMVQLLDNTDLTTTKNNPLAIPLQQIQTTSLQFTKEPLGIGWHYLTLPKDLPGWLFKILGWVIATILIAGTGFATFLSLNASILNTVFTTKTTDYFLLDKIYPTPAIPNVVPDTVENTETTLPITVAEPAPENKEMNLQNVEFIQRPVG